MRPALLAFACALLLAGCARQALFVVLPNEEGGGVGAITVDDGASRTTLNQPFASAESRAGKAAPVAEERGNISVIFRNALLAQPVLPHRFRLYFIFGGDDLTPESVAAYRAVFDDIKQRAAYEVEVIGHTDTVGTPAYNQALSRARAAAMRDRLGRDGLDTGAISIAGRGKLDLLVPTADQTPEPRNRRVEILVR
jgi:outer membrane protein OmpA-like peptidoglycan-associated protein